MIDLPNLCHRNTEILDNHIHKDPWGLNRRPLRACASLGEPVWHPKLLTLQALFVIEATREGEHGQTLLPANLLRTVQNLCVCVCVRVSTI